MMPLSHSPSWFLASSEATADIGWQALGPTIAFTALALIAVVLRWYTRIHLIRNIGPEDLLVTFALILSLVMAGVAGGEVAIDVKSQPESARPILLTRMLKLVYVQSISFHIAINLVKASIILQYIAVFSANKCMRYTCFVLLSIIAVAAAWGVFGIVFMCSPVDRYWRPQIQGTCLSAEHHFWSTATLGIALDFAGWVLPMPVIGRLSLPRRQKLGLMGVFGLGAFVCIVSILRLALVHDAAYKGEVTKAGVYILIWSTTEVNVAIICASLLVLKPLLIRWFPSLMVDKTISTKEQARQIKDALRDLTISTIDEEKGWWKRSMSTISNVGGRKKESTSKEEQETHERRQNAFIRELGEILVQDVPAVEHPDAENYLREFRDLTWDERLGWYR